MVLSPRNGGSRRRNTRPDKRRFHAFTKSGEHDVDYAWLILGLIAGFIASKIVNKSGEGLILDIVLGIVGAVVGGFVFSTFGAAPVTGLNIYSMIVAVIGAVIVLVAYHAITGNRRTL